MATDRKQHTFEDLINIVACLRNPDTGCPWDLEQTHQSLKPYLLEEAYEVLDAIDFEESGLCGELGDLLLQIMLHSQIASERSAFSVADVIDSIAAKLIHRHPHVFEGESLQTSAEVVRRWEELKKQERGDASSVLDGIPRSMAALSRADKIGRRVARVGFEWEKAQDVATKVKEEVGELLVALETDSGSELVEEEFGDVLFTLAQLARKLGFQPELILQRANEKFIERFRMLESLASAPLEELSFEDLHSLWDQVKKSNSTSKGK